MTTAATETVDVDLGGRTVAVPKGGLYDRFRMDTPLDEVATDPRAPGVDFLRPLPTTRAHSPIRARVALQCRSPARSTDAASAAPSPETPGATWRFASGRNIRVTYWSP